MVSGIVGNPDYRAETFTDLETGYRVEVGPHAAVDVTAFRGRYSDLQTLEPLPPVLELLPAPAHLFTAARLENLLSVRTRGVGVAAHWIPVESWWRLDGFLSELDLTPRVDAASLDTAAPRFDGSAPGQQWQLQSTGTVSPRHPREQPRAFHSGRLRQLGVPAYTRADIRLQGDINK